MARHLPSLSALRAFEATARHLSFTRAGIELSLTQTAISHRIKELEGLLSVQLFTRTQSGISLTDEGREYLEAVRPALAQIAIATDGVSSVRENRLSVTCLIAFAVYRLVPALPDFRERHPEIELRLTPTLPVERSLKDFDVAIWHGPEEWPGLTARRIAEEEVFPVCAPELLRGRPPLETPADLRHYPVIRNVSPIIEDEWPAWLQQAGAPTAGFGSEIFCGGMFFTMSAALSGVGVGIGRSSLVEQHLRTGRLVEPFRHRLASSSAYYAVSRPERSAQPKVRAFTDWLLQTLGD
jgi:LysR family glycine cleavage system transcriptional activator